MNFLDKKNYKLLIFITIIIVIFAPALLTKVETLIIFDENSSAVATTIGAIISPIISFLAAILIYLTLQEQVDANKQLLENQNIDRFNREYEEIKNEYFKINFNKKELHPNLKNKAFESPIHMYARDLELQKEGNIAFEYQFKYIFYLIKYFIEELENSNLKEVSKALFIKKVYQFYFSKIEFHIQEAFEYGEEYEYNSIFIRLGEEVNVIIEKKREKYKIQDSNKY